LTDAQKVARQNKKACLANLCEVIHKKVTANNARMPYGYMATFLTKADALLSSANKDVTKMSNKDLSIVLKSLKRNGDKMIPTKKNEMISTYEEWKERKPLEFDTDDEFVSVSIPELESVMLRITRL